MQLIWHSIIIFILSRTWIFIFNIKYWYFIAAFINLLLSIYKFIEAIHRFWFFLIIEIHTWTRIHSFCLFLKSRCFWIEITLVTFIITYFRCMMIIVLSWAWRFWWGDFFITKTICLWIETWISYFLRIWII